MANRNLVAHCSKGSSDKVYMACVRHNPSAGNFTVIGKWGRRGRSNLQQQIKLTTANESAAVAEQRRLFEAKLKTGYVDIESPAYGGPLSMNSPEVKQNLEGGGAAAPMMPKSKPKPKPKPKPVTPDTPQEVIVECVDNAGMEDKFDQGIYTRRGSV